MSIEGYYTKQDGLNYEFQCRWIKAHSRDGNTEGVIKEFPNNEKNFLNEYHAFEEKMNRDWHPEVNLGAVVAEGQLLTDHGVSHVKSVIAHSRDILSNKSGITGYEIFILLMAIHFHDIGNLKGRQDHEKKIFDILEKMGDDVPLDVSEKRIVTSIAVAHGGSTDDGDKDTIGHISPSETYGGIPVHMRELAAVLRFADEISDDCNRAKIMRVEIPHGNQAYYEYSKSLAPISVIGDAIKFEFDIPHKFITDKVGKGEADVYLYDEILSRLTKCMRELEYCRKYANGWISILKLDVKINVLKKESTFQKIKELSQAFRLTLHGYPDETKTRISDYMEHEPGRGKAISYDSGDKIREALEAQESEESKDE